MAGKSVVPRDNYKKKHNDISKDQTQIFRIHSPVQAINLRSIYILNNCFVKLKFVFHWTSLYFVFTSNLRNKFGS